LNKESITIIFKVAIPKNTTEESNTPIIEGSALSGKIVKMHVDVPQGVQFSAGFRIQFGDRRYPQPMKDASDYFSGENTKLDLKPNIVVKEAIPKIYGVNNSTTTDHTMLITIEIEVGEES